MKLGCLGCIERTLNCHSTCKDYQEYKKEKDKINRAKKLEQEADAVAIENIARIQKALSRR